MGRGLGRIQRKVLEVLKYNKEQGKGGFEFVEDQENILGRSITFTFRKHTTEGNRWFDVGSLLPEVVYGVDFWRREDSKDLNDEALIQELEQKGWGNWVTESEKQAIWRAIRTLEKRGLVETCVYGQDERVGSSINKRGGPMRSNYVRLSV